MIKIGDTVYFQASPLTINNICIKIVDSGQYECVVETSNGEYPIWMFMHLIKNGDITTTPEFYHRLKRARIVNFLRTLNVLTESDTQIVVDMPPNRIFYHKNTQEGEIHFGYAPNSVVKPFFTLNELKDIL